MRPFITLCLLILASSFFAQSAWESSGLLNLEWKRELNAEDRISALLVKNEVVLAGTPSGIYSYDLLGEFFKHSPVSSGIFGMQTLHDGRLYTAGARHLSLFDPNSNRTEEIALMLSPEIHLTAENGGIMNSMYYTTHHDSYFVKYNMHGGVIFVKEIGEICSNKYLQTGGGYIYIYSIINKPALGARLMQYDTLGNQKWSLPMGDVRAMLADEKGSCYIAPVNVESTLQKLDIEGKVVWLRPVTGQFIEGMSKRGDSIFVCGRLKLGSPENQLCAYSIISAKTGEIMQQQSFSIYQPATVPEHFSQIASDGENVYVGGVYGGQSKTSFLIKLSREGSATGLKDENGKRNSFNVFPNPGGSRFTITCGNNAKGSVDVSVRNISGQVVYSKKIECNADKSFTLDLGKQAAGSYTVEIDNGAEKMARKIIVE